VIAYRVHVGLTRWAIALLAVPFILVFAGGAPASERATADLRLDGMPFSPELALTSDQRALGLMHRKRAPRDGMLFVFPSDTTGGFWMKNTLVPLKIVFYDASGKRVRKFVMTPCRQESCPIYDPGRRYRFALELRASDSRPAAKLGPLLHLRRLSRRAS
jgi:uncharacterized membrane protein (UPF0127 family)